MKKILLLSLAVLAAVGLWSCSDDDKDLNPTELPAAAKTFINTYFPDATVKKVKLDTEFAGAEYDVTLSNGFELEFTQTGDWVDIDAPKGQSVPAAIVPVPITAYVIQNFPDSQINEISRIYPGYQIELNNGVELSFNSDGQIIGYGS